MFLFQKKVDKQLADLHKKYEKTGEEEKEELAFERKDRIAVWIAAFLVLAPVILIIAGIFLLVLWILVFRFAS